MSWRKEEILAIVKSKIASASVNRVPDIVISTILTTISPDHEIQIQ